MADDHSTQGGWQFQLEAAVSLYELSIALDDYSIPEAAITCLVMARSARSALCAVLLYRGEPMVSLTACNLLQLVRRIWNELDVEIPTGLVDAARTLSQVLVLTSADAGHDHVSRDLFSPEQTRACTAAAYLLLDETVKLLFGMPVATLHANHSGIRRRAWDDPLCWNDLDPLRRRC